MSTKIYYAYKYPGPTWEIYETLYRKLEAAFERNWDTLVVSGGFRTHEQQVTLWKAFEGARNSPFRDSLDISCSVVLLPEHDATYMILYAADRWVESYHEVITGITEVEDFTYWNNTDRPDHLTQEEWDARRDKWDELVGRDRPTARGPILSVGGLHYPMPWRIKWEDFKEWITEEFDKIRGS